jgi:hypothetical protein
MLKTTLSLASLTFIVTVGRWSRAFYGFEAEAAEEA